MNSLGKIWKTKKSAVALTILVFLGSWGNASAVLAHGGEDHGAEKPKTTTAKGIVSRSARVGDLEITLKTPVLEPDEAASAKLFITKYETNEAAGDVAPTMEIESAGGGAVTRIIAEKSDVAGSFSLKIPALAEGKYTIRTSIKSGKGIDTATFAGIEVAHTEAASESAGGTLFSLSNAMFFGAGVIILGLFGSLFYFAWRTATGGKRIGGEAISA